MASHGSNSKCLNLCVLLKQKEDALEELESARCAAEQEKSAAVKECQKRQETV